MVGTGLHSDEFEFSTNIGGWVANSSLRWLRQVDVVVPTTVVSDNEVKAEVIGSYEEFKTVALDVYDKLNYEHNLDDLVQIYRIMRDMGERVSRTEFNDWLLEMQAEDIFQLMSGEMPDITPDRRDDSLTIPGGGLRYYAKKLQ